MVYDSLENMGKIIHKSIYGEGGIATYDASVQYYDLQASIISISEDSAYVRLQLHEPKYELFHFYIGEIEPHFRKGKEHLKLYQRDTNSFVTVPYFIRNKDTLMLEGYISNFDIRLINDSTGVTIGDEIYFNQKLILENP